MAHGGNRVGAGRRATKLSREAVPLKRATAEVILAGIDEEAFWQDMLTAETVTSVHVIGGEDGGRENVTIPDRKIRIEAAKYLTDKRDGKAAQAIQHTGPDGKAPTVRVLIEHIGLTHTASAETERPVESMG